MITAIKFLVLFFPFAIVNLPLLLAQAIEGTAPAAWWMPLINLGGIGVVLFWFMFRNEPRLRNIEAAIDRSSRAYMVLVLSVKGISREAQEMAQTVITEVDSNTTRDRK